jgi:general secretion pathway protein E
MYLGEILIEWGKASRPQIEAALEKQKREPVRRRIGEILVEDGVIQEADLLQALARQFGAEVASLVEESMLDPSLVAKLPVEWARANQMLPIRRDGHIAVLTCDPTRMAPLEDLALLLDCEPIPMLAPRREILRSIERCYFQKHDSAEELLRDMKAPTVRAPESESDDLLRKADQAPVAQLVNVILLEAVKARASDVHIEPFEKKIMVRYRIDGLLYEQASPPKHLEAALVSRLKVMARLDIAEKRLPQDGTARVRVGEREIDIRVSTIPVAEGERVVLRLLNRDSTLLPLGDLGMPEDVLSRFRQVLQEPNGVVLVTGPTGSGKTTTLYASLREIDTSHLNVLTIEDPIEYQLPHIGQMQVKPKIGLTFAQGLRHILRQDPDVILVGETRDLETAEIVVRASMTGHLVFSTLHTNDAAGAVIRLMDMGVPSYLLASSVRASMAQRLVRRLCPLCREETKPSAEELKALGPLSDRFAHSRVWKARGCPSCLGGYKGRTGIYELMIVNTAMQEAIREGRSVEELTRMAEAAGMRSLMSDGLAKVQQGETSLSEVLRAVGRNVSE